MKKAFLILFSVLSPFFALAQGEYYVVLHVKGKVSLEKTGAILKPSDKISEEEKVVFGSEGDLVAVIHPSKGRRVMRPVNAQGGSQGSELVAFVKNTLVAGTGRASTRAGKFTNFLEIDSFFTADPLVYYRGLVALIGEEVAFQVSAEAFPLDAQNFFFARYEYGGETISKKLGFAGSVFLLNATSLYQVDGQPIDPLKTGEVKLYYRNASTKESTYITKFQPNFIEEEELKGELSLLLEYYLKGKGEETITQELLGYLADAHGRIDKDHLHSFLDKHFEGWRG